MATVIERPDDPRVARQRRAFETLVRRGSVGAGVVVPSLVALITAKTAASLIDVIRCVAVIGLGVVFVALCTLAVRARGSHGLRGWKLAEVAGVAAMPLAGIVAFALAPDWSAWIILGVLVAFGLGWVRILEYFPQDVGSTATSAEEWAANAVTRFGRSLWPLGLRFVALGRTLALGMTVALCAYVISVLLLGLTAMQAAVAVSAFVDAVSDTSNDHGQRDENGNPTTTATTTVSTSTSTSMPSPTVQLKPPTPPPSPPSPPRSPPPPPQPASEEASWAEVCGETAELPGFDRPAPEAAKFQELYYGPGQPGAEGTGCTGRTHPVPGFPDIRYVVGVEADRPNRPQSIAIVWRTRYGSYEGAIVIAPATTIFWRLVKKFGRVRSVWRINAGAGDLVVLWTDFGTWLLVRPAKAVSGHPGPYVLLPPPAADTWIYEVERRRQWLWPVPAKAPAGQRAFKLVTDPILRDEVVRIASPAGATMGSEISVERIERYAPPEE